MLSGRASAQQAVCRGPACSVVEHLPSKQCVVDLQLMVEHLCRKPACSVVEHLPSMVVDLHAQW